MELQLSENFWLSEFLASQTAKRRPEVAGDQFEPPAEIIENLEYLCGCTVQPLRTLLKTPMRISSGFRSAELNTAIGGSESSQHVRGEAADIVMSERLLFDDELAREREVIDHMVFERVGKTPRADVNANFYLFAAGCLYANELDIDQIIHEYGEPGQPAWVHLSSSIDRNRREILIIPRQQGKASSRLTLEEALLLGC